jgi:Holliday junction resolvasome RuvABC endonuclease subunit
MTNQISKNILVIDPANSTGYCIVSVKDDCADIFLYKFIDIEEHEYLGDRYIEISKKIKDIIIAHEITEVAIEDFFFSGKFANGVALNVGYRAVIHMACRELGLHYTILNMALWKKFIVGHSMPTKEQKKKWGKQASKKIMVQEALWNKWGIRFPNHSVSKIGRNIKFRYDVVDSVAMCIYFLSEFKNIKNVSCTVPVTDIVWEKSPNGLFQY